MRGYDEVRAALYALVPRGIVLGLDPVREALAALGNPQEKLPAVHIAGTNGKGSVAAMVDAGLRAHGLRVGLYTSPHLHRFAERIRIGGTPADEQALAAAGGRVLDAMDAKKIPALTFFEAVTVMAWEVFANAGLDAVVLEVGLGGRLDATNVCAPRVTAITRIALDHQAQLGDSTAQIAREKAGILKPGVACVLGPELRSGEAREAIDAEAARVGSTLIDAPDALEVSRGDDGRWEFDVPVGDARVHARLALGGAHQVENAIVAAAILAQWGATPDAVRGGLEGARWPARLETVGNHLFDAAHNPDGALALHIELCRRHAADGSAALVFGASSDKDWRGMLDAIGGDFTPAKRFYAAAGLKRAESPEAIAAAVDGRPCASVAEALSLARASVGTDGLVVVCGSIFLVAEARALVLGESSDPPVPM